MALWETLKFSLLVSIEAPIHKYFFRAQNYNPEKNCNNTTNNLIVLRRRIRRIVAILLRITIAGTTRAKVRVSGFRV